MIQLDVGIMVQSVGIELDALRGTRTNGHLGHLLREIQEQAIEVNLGCFITIGGLVGPTPSEYDEDMMQ